MMKLISTLKQANLAFNNIMLFLAGIILTCSMLLIVFNGVIRIFLPPFGAVVEVVSWCAAIVTVFSLGSTQITKGHVYIDLLFNKFPSILKKTIEFITITLSIIFFSVVVFQLVKYGLEFKANGTLSTTLRIQFYPIVIIVGLGFISLITTLIIDLLGIFVSKGDEEWVQEQSL